MHFSSAGEVIQSLVMQMSRERREKGRDCALPYFAADSIIPAYIDSRLTFCDNPDPKVAQVTGTGTSSLGSSRISCLPLYLLAQLDNPTLCEAHAVALQLPLLINSENQSPWLQLQRGALKGSCTQRSMPPKVLTHCLHDWFNQAFVASSNVTCDQWVEHDTYIVTRHDSLSAWYTLSDMWFAFLSAAVFKLQPHSARAIFADAQPSGVAASFWSTAFSAAAPLPLQQLAKQKMSEGVRTLCFRRAIFNPSATTSGLERGLQHVQGRMACSDNLLLQAFATQVRMLMTAEDPPPANPLSVSVFFLKDDSLPPSSDHLFSLLQRRLSPSASIVVANVRRSSFKQIVTAIAHASLLLATSDTAAAYALYLRPHSACVSLQFEEAPLLRMRLITSWARIAHRRSASFCPPASSSH
jgi:hypothetical protein